MIPTTAAQNNLSLFVIIQHTRQAYLAIPGRPVINAFTSFIFHIFPYTPYTIYHKQTFFHSHSI